jgi:hypothetical protein
MVGKIQSSLRRLYLVGDGELRGQSLEAITFADLRN